MKFCATCKCTKPFSEFYPRPDRPGGYIPKCKPCKAAAAAAYRARNMDECRARSRQWYAENAERATANTRAWQLRNADTQAKKRQEYRARNADEIRLAWRNWRDSNRDVVRRLKAQRRATLKCAAVAWADPKAIRSIYARALHLSMTTGVEHHVDHIVPLQHPLVCGLHVEHNLRAIPKRDNQRKYNKLEV